MTTTEPTTTPTEDAADHAWAGPAWQGKQHRSPLLQHHRAAPRRAVLGCATAAGPRS